MPADYSHITIKEKVYMYSKKVTEKILIEADLEKTDGFIQIQKELDSNNDNLTVFNFEIPMTSSASLIESNSYLLSSEYFNVFGANTNKINNSKINLFAYKENRNR